MRELRRLWPRCQPSSTWSLTLLLALIVTPCAAPTAAGGPPTPDGVCCPVNGTGYIVTYTDTLRQEGLKIPIATLSPLVEGDSLVVKTGTVTFIDFRNGQSSIFGAGTRLRIPAVIDPKRPSWWEHLEDLLVRSMSDPERNRMGGAVRGGRTAFWPEHGRFAPEVPIVFEWWRVRPAPVVLQICIGEDVTELALSRGEPGSDAVAWRPADPATSGRVSWYLLDEEGERIGGGEFVILTKEEAENERRRFRKAAAEIEVIPQELAAAVLAAADRVFLW
jgi:hypothetical protein